MSQFQYRATNDRGQVVEGKLLANSTKNAVTQLERMGLKLENLQRLPIELDAMQVCDPEQRARFETLRSRAVHNAQQWSAPMKALADEIGSREIAHTLRRTALRLSQVNRVDELCQYSETARVFPFVIHELDSSANAQSESWLERLAKDIQAKKQFRRELMVPLITFGFFLSLIVVGAIWIVPIFKDMFDEFGLTLAPPTKLLFTISGWIYPHYLRSLTVLTAAAILFWLIWNANNKYDWTSRFLPRLVSGSRSNLRNVAYLALSLVEFRRLGYPIPQAMLLAIEGCPSVYLKKQVESFAVTELNGRPTNLESLRLLPATLIALLYSDPDNIQALNVLGNLYTDRERVSSSRLPFILSNLIILAMGLIVGFVVFALFLPQVKMVTSLAG